MADYRVMRRLAPLLWLPIGLLAAGVALAAQPNTAFGPIPGGSRVAGHRVVKPAAISDSRRGAASASYRLAWPLPQ